MGLLAGKAYDPATAVAKSTVALLPMTALDTTNLRLTFNAPANGSVMVRIQGTISGAATFPQILLGVLEGTTIRGRVAPAGLLNGNLAATTFMTVEALFLVTGLTPGASLTWDAAYGVETIVANTAIRYGGPNDSTTNTAWGALLYEVWTTA